MSRMTDSFSYSVLNLPEGERPRERLVRHGSESLSATELIAIILGSGTKATPVLQMAQEIVVRFGTLQALAEATISELCKVKGIGMAKAIQLKASLSLGLRAGRHQIQNKFKIETPLHAYQLIKEELQSEKREVFAIILLDVKGCLITHQTIAIGTLTNALIHPREVFFPAIKHQAASLIAVHNHPSGDLTPSKEDYQVTKQLIETGKVVGIPLHDHLIVSTHGYVSLRQKGFVFNS